MISLDTSIVIDLLRGEKTLQDRLSQERYGISPIVLAELFKGAFLSSKQSAAIALVTEFAENAELLALDLNTCILFGRKHTELTRLGKQTQIADLLIACTAMAHNAILITRNPKDVKNISGLKFEVW